MAGKSPFLSREAAVLCALRCMASISRHFERAACSARIVNILSKTTRQLHRMKRLFKILCGPIRFQGILPLQTVVDYINDPAQNTSIIHAWHSMRQRKKRLDPLHLTFRQQKYITRRLTSIGKTVESQRLSHCYKLTGPKPKNIKLRKNFP